MRHSLNRVGVGVAIVWSLFVLGIATVLATAAGAERTADRFVPYVTQSKTAWTMQSWVQAHTHKGCIVSRTMQDGVQVSVAFYATGEVVARLVGPDFLIARSEPALVQADDEVPHSVWATYVGPVTVMVQLPKGDAIVNEIKTKRVLKFVVNDLRYDVDLTGSGKLVQEIRTCNEKGQAAYDRERVSRSSRALIRI